MSLINLLFKPFESIPYVGKRMKINKLNKVLLDIEDIKKQFNKPMVRFDDNIHRLYDCLKGLDLTLVEDYEWYLSLDITTRTKTSVGASRYITEHINNLFPKEDIYFRESNVSNISVRFLDWCNNTESLQEFVFKFLYVLDLYCEENPKVIKCFSDDPEIQGDVFVGHNVYKPLRSKELNYSLLEFFNNNTFRLILDDFITSVQVVIYSQLGGLNGHRI